MSVSGKRELLVQVAGRYGAAAPAQKSIILDEFVAATGYARKYAIRLLAEPLPPRALIRRARERRYGPAVQEALVLCWRAANEVCAKRLAPFLPELVAALEHHGHLTLCAEDRAQLLCVSAATVDRWLRPQREQVGAHGLSTTKPGALLKRQVPVRTFQDWDDAGRAAWKSTWLLIVAGARKAPSCRPWCSRMSPPAGRSACRCYIAASKR